MERCEMDLEGWARRLRAPRTPEHGLDAVRVFKTILAGWEEHHVRAARAQGVWWLTIAWSLGVTEQAVHKRWAARLQDVPDERARAPVEAFCSKPFCARHRPRFPLR